MAGMKFEHLCVLARVKAACLAHECGCFRTLSGEPDYPKEDHLLCVELEEMGFVKGREIEPGHYAWELP